MLPEVMLTYEQISQLPKEIREIYRSHRIKIRANSELENILNICENIRGEIDRSDYVKMANICHSQRVVKAIFDARNENNLSEHLRRISSNSPRPSSIEPSSGKDAMFELEFIQYIQHHGLSAKLGEPDVIVDTPLGHYYIACKTINSFANLEKQLGKGGRQIKSQGNGCIALNLEPSICSIFPLIGCRQEVGIIATKKLVEIYRPYERLFENEICKDRTDGIIIQGSFAAKLKESKSDFDIFTITSFFYSKNRQNYLPRSRFDWLRKALSGPFSSHISNYT